MMPSVRANRRPRRGTVVPTLAVFLVVLVAMLAFSVDLGRVALCRAQLQNAADSAALAGASALGTDNQIVPYQSGIQASDIASARALAQQFAQANGYDVNATTSVVLDRNNDVGTGILSYPYSLSSAYATSGTTAFNSVTVGTHIDSTHGGNLNFFFAPVLRQFFTQVGATATATVQLFPVASVKPVYGSSSPFLPITMSYSDWQKMVNNQTGVDDYGYNASTGQVTSGSDGLQEQQLYPGSNVTSSNNGLLQFGTSSHSNRVLSDELSNGPTYDQMIAQWPPSGSPPWNDQHTFTINADPGWRAEDFDALADSIGKVRLIPINDGTSPGSGANGFYTIVKLAPVRILTSNKGGKNSGSAMVQPAVLNDGTLIPDTTPLPPSSFSQGGIPITRLTR
jgi:Flp pilus assembly protein TadG